MRPEKERSWIGEGWVAAGGTLASAVLVASHCLAPVIFLLFGTTVGALSALNALQPYRPWFIAAGFGFWGYGVYRLYFRSRAGNDGAVCASGYGSASAWTRTLLWVGLGVLLVAIVLPKLALYLAS